MTEKAHSHAAFSHEWEEAYQAGRHLTKWPSTDLVSFVYRYASPTMGFKRVLEIGCGPGANIPFFLKLGMSYFAMDGSESAVASALADFPLLEGQVVAGDFTDKIPFADDFDLIVDRAALIHNSTESILKSMKMIVERLRPGGKFIAIDWFTTGHQDSQSGDFVDKRTRANISQGPFAGIGNVHFCSREDVLDLVDVSGLRLERLTHKKTEVVFPETCDSFEFWNFVAVKP